MSAELNPSLDMDLVPCETRKCFHGGSHVGWAGDSLLTDWLVVSALDDFAIKLHSPRAWSLLVISGHGEPCTVGPDFGAVLPWARQLLSDTRDWLKLVSEAVILDRSRTLCTLLDQHALCGRRLSCIIWKT